MSLFRETCLFFSEFSNYGKSTIFLWFRKRWLLLRRPPRDWGHSPNVWRGDMNLTCLGKVPEDIGIRHLKSLLATQCAVKKNKRKKENLSVREDFRPRPGAKRFRPRTAEKRMRYRAKLGIACGSWSMTCTSQYRKIRKRERIEVVSRDMYLTRRTASHIRPCTKQFRCLGVCRISHRFCWKEVLRPKLCRRERLFFCREGMLMRSAVNRSWVLSRGYHNADGSFSVAQAHRAGKVWQGMQRSCEQNWIVERVSEQVLCCFWQGCTGLHEEVWWHHW
jgi:hypothetical protein